MKRSMLALATCLALAIAAAPVNAKQAKSENDDESTRPVQSSGSYSGGGTTSTPWGKTFGLGLQVGAPTAITGKLKLEPNSALVFTVGGAWSWGYGYGLELSVGYVIHPSMLASYEALNLNWYVGGALDVLLRGDPHYHSQFAWQYGYWSSPIGIGAHVPIGLDFQLRAVPLSIYLELTPGIDVFPYLGIRLGGALGARFFF